MPTKYCSEIDTNCLPNIAVKLFCSPGEAESFMGSNAPQ